MRALWHRVGSRSREIILIRDRKGHRDTERSHMETESGVRLPPAMEHLAATELCSSRRGREDPSLQLCWQHLDLRNCSNKFSLFEAKKSWYRCVIKSVENKYWQ